jgi:pSer/pThr/pTyr-binding forkhead associated (FHA) protein
MCGSPLGLSYREESGAETVFHPQSLAEGLPPRSREASPDLPPAEATAATPAAGTLLLKGDENAGPGSVPKVKLRGHLIRCGSGSEDHPYRLDRERTVVGRDHGDITVEDPSLSGRHFEIEARGEEHFVRDLDSTNGTQLNGHQVRSAKLISGDTIRAGKTTFVFRLIEMIALD